MQNQAINALTFYDEKTLGMCGNYSRRSVQQLFRPAVERSGLHSLATLHLAMAFFCHAFVGARHGFALCSALIGASFQQNDGALRLYYSAAGGEVGQSVGLFEMEG